MQFEKDSLVYEICTEIRNNAEPVHTLFIGRVKEIVDEFIIYEVTRKFAYIGNYPELGRKLPTGNFSKYQGFTSELKAGYKENVQLVFIY